MLCQPPQTQETRGGQIPRWPAAVASDRRSPDLSPESELAQTIEAEAVSEVQSLRKQATHDILLSLRLDLGASTSEFQRLERLRTVLLLCRDCADDANVRIATERVLKQMRELRVTVGDM